MITGFLLRALDRRISIAIGIILGGIVGALFAVPLLAFAKTFVQHLSDQLPTPSTN